MAKERKRRITIKDLPRNRKITREEMNKVLGGSVLGRVSSGVNNIVDETTNMVGSTLLGLASGTTEALKGALSGSGDDSSTGGGSKPSLKIFQTR